MQVDLMTFGLERARSLSPTKDSPLAATPSSMKPGPGVAERYRASPTPSIEPGAFALAEATSRPAKPEKLGITRNSANQLAQTDFEPSKPSPPPSNNNSLSRSGTLSWQQRPSSRDSGTAKSRPLSLLASENNAQKSPRAPSDTSQLKEQEMSRTDAARALEGKDPSWFRQTAERGVGSAAYRKNIDDDPRRSGGSIKLPGMSKSPDARHDEDFTQRSENADKRSSGESAAKSNFSTPQSSNTMSLSSRSKSPLPLFPSQRLEPAQGTEGVGLPRDASPTRGLAMSPSQRSLSPERTERPSSPTKGLGGFVQSAMLKRSDSINKHMRANSQVNPLSRSNSVLSSHNIEEGEPAAATNEGVQDEDGFMKPAIPNRYQAQNQEQPQPHGSQAVLPTTPSRTMDQKRWSPTKTTWLETAIQKTDSPKPKPSPQKPPAWLSELQKSKQSGSLNDESKTVSHKQVEVGGFMRSPALGSPTKSPNLSGPTTPAPDNSSLFDLPNSMAKAKTAAPETKPANTIGAKVAATAVSPSLTTSEQSQPSPKLDKIKDGAESPKPAVGARKTSASTRPKPETPPKKDFRSHLKSHDSLKGKASSEEPEFKNVFGKLKKTETKNYVAPDELRDNITRGKAGLAITGGPRKYEKRDDFKDSILKKKEDMKTSGSIRGKPTPAPKITGASIPEAIAKQRGLVPKDPAVESKAEASKPGAPQKQTSVQVEGPKMAPLEKKTSAPARLQVGAGNAASNLAGRFNPALADIIARGPSSVSASGPPSRTESPKPLEDHGLSDDPSKTSELTHATKSRARGPKRRLPQGPKAIEQATVHENRKPEAVASQAKAVEEEPAAKRRPPEIMTPKPSFPNTTIPSSAKSGQSISPPGTLRSPTKSETRTPTSPLPTVKLSPTLTTKAAPTVKPKRTSSQTVNEEKTSTPAKASASSNSTVSYEQGVFPKSPKSPPVPATKPKIVTKIASNGVSGPEILESKPGFSARPSRKTFTSLLDPFFDDVHTSSGRVSIDTNSLLTGTSAGNGKIKTLRKEIWELTGGGKKEPLASHQEHILSEDKMYFCKHIFGSASGKRTTEAYLWCGDQVSQSAIEDAQLFARNEAKDAGGKLQVLAQGKESSNFFEALGGIVITRRSSGTTYTLCGRRHMGHIAFDEVDHCQDSLCSGFPFIVAAADGTLYLWKGKGSNADELGCARLIGMDLGLTGEIEEIDEGAEPFEFFRTLKSTGKKPASAKHWSLKGNSEQYGTRLFAIDTEARPKSSSGFTGLFTRRPSVPSNEDSSGQIREISPYSQADIARDGIYMLDAFFETYVYVMTF